MYSSKQRFEINGSTDEELGIILNCAINLFNEKRLPSYYARHDNKLYLGWMQKGEFTQIIPEFPMTEELLIAFIKSFLTTPHIYDQINMNYKNVLASFDGSVEKGFRAFLPTLNSSSKDYFSDASCTVIGFQPDLIFFSK